MLLHDHDEDRPDERLDFVLATTRHLLRTAHAQGLAVRPLLALA